MNAQTELTIADTSGVWHQCGVFLINLDRSSDRLALAQTNLTHAGIPFQRIAGFDASKEDLSQCQIDLAAFRRAHGRSAPRKAEIGVYQSHLLAISAFLESGKEFGVILEDDAAPDIRLASTITQLITWKNDWDIVPLFHFHRGGPLELQKQNGYSLTVYMAHISSAAAYLINRHAAKVLFNNLRIQHACIDHILFEHWTHDLKLRGIKPMPVHLSEQAQVSTILAEGTEKLSFLMRLPTFYGRLMHALRFFFCAIRDVLKYKLVSS